MLAQTMSTRAVFAVKCVALDRSHAPIAIGAWDRSSATHLTANTARVDIVCASMARGRRVVRTRARARGRRARDGIEAIDARWARVWVSVGGVCSCVEGVRS